MEAVAGAGGAGRRRRTVDGGTGRWTRTECHGGSGAGGFTGDGFGSEIAGLTDDALGTMVDGVDEYRKPYKKICGKK